MSSAATGWHDFNFHQVCNVCGELSADVHNLGNPALQSTGYYVPCLGSSAGVVAARTPTSVQIHPTVAAAMTHNWATNKNVCADCGASGTVVSSIPCPRARPAARTPTPIQTPAVGPAPAMHFWGTPVSGHTYCVDCGVSQTAAAIHGPVLPNARRSDAYTDSDSRVQSGTAYVGLFASRPDVQGLRRRWVVSQVCVPEPSRAVFLRRSRPNSPRDSPRQV